MRSLKAAYRQTFKIGNHDAELVLEDLMRWGRIRESTFDEDPIKAAHNQGQRDVVLHILRFLNLPEKYFWDSMVEGDRLERDE